MPTSIAIIGGGIPGVTSAYPRPPRLCRRLFEKHRYQAEDLVRGGGQLLGLQRRVWAQFHHQRLQVDLLKNPVTAAGEPKPGCTNVVVSEFIAA